MTSGSPLGPHLQAFFVEHLLGHKRASPQTIVSYRDAFRLLLGYLQATTGKEPASLLLTDLDAPALLGFLDDLEVRRRNSTRTRNARLAAFRSFFRYVALREPESLALITRVLAIPAKRADRKLVGYLTRNEIDAVLAAPDRNSWTGRRDHVLLLTLYNTGARVSEVTALRRGDVTFGPGASVLLHGKGRKERAVPLWARTARSLREWWSELGDKADDAAFPNARGRPLTRFGIAYILGQAVELAQVHCQSLRTKRVSPHVLRHTTAMHLLQGGVDVAVIALWLGHESLETTHVYVEADLAMKQRALAKLTPAATRSRRYKPDDQLLAFLTAL